VFTLALTGDQQDAVFDGDLDLVFFETGQFGFDQVFLFILADIDQRSPLRFREPTVLVPVLDMIRPKKS